MSNDVIIIGAGHNGLAAAVRLALAGRKVVVLERRDIPGGLCARRAFHDGYTAPGVLHDTDRVRPALVDALGLAKQGCALDSGDVPFLAAAQDGAGLLLHRDPDKARAELERRAPEDINAYVAWRGFIDRVGGFIGDVLNQRLPPLNAASVVDLWELGKRGLALRRLGKTDMIELLRVAPMAVSDWLNESLDSGPLAALLAAPAVIGTWCGPRAAGTAANLLFHECAVTSSGLPGGPAALVDALVASCKANGVEIRTEASVKRIITEGDTAKGVELDSGEKLTAKTVAAACDPKHALLDLVHPAALPARVENQFRVIRTRGTTAKVHLALDGALEFNGREGESILRARTGAELDDLERAFDAVKYREMSEVPHLDIRIFKGQHVAPEGHCVASIVVSFAPYAIEGGWSDERREELGDRVVDVLSRYAPTVKERIVGREVLTPADLASQYRLTGGHIHHVEHSLDQQLFMRPAPCAARYSTPLKGLYVVGSGSHPGGGVTCAPGALGAGAILADDG